MNNKSEETIKKVIYILTFGMSIHVLLNFGCDLALRGVEMFTRNSHLDIWTLDEYATTQTATNYIFIIGIMYYVFIYENNKITRNVFISLFVLLMIYDLALGRRTPILLFIISLLISFFVDLIINKKRDKKIKKIIVIIISIFAIIFGFGIYYYFNIYNPWEWRKELSIFHKIFFFGLNSNRINIFIDAVKIAPQHLWGGKEISILLNNNIHDLWMDTFDYAGIIPYIFLIFYSIIILFTLIKIFKNNSISKSFKLLIIILYFCIIIQMFLEPIITGSPIFLLCTIIVNTLLESLIEGCNE